MLTNWQGRCFPTFLAAHCCWGAAGVLLTRANTHRSSTVQPATQASQLNHLQKPWAPVLTAAEVVQGWAPDTDSIPLQRPCTGLLRVHISCTSMIHVISTASMAERGVLGQRRGLSLLHMLSLLHRHALCATMIEVCSCRFAHSSGAASSNSRVCCADLLLLCIFCVC